MNCDEARQLIHAYLDDELDIATALKIEAHLADCPACQQRLESARLVGRAVANEAQYHAAPAALRERLKQAIRAESQELEPAPRRRLAIPWRKQFGPLLAVAAVIVLVVGATLYFQQPPAKNAQVAELLDAHLRSLEPAHLMDVESTDQHTVKPWFAGKVDFSPPVTDLAAEGFPLIGGRLDYFEQTKVAALVYRRNKHVINLFIRPGETTSEITTRQGYNIIRFSYKGMTCWAVSDLNAAELQQFIGLFCGRGPASSHS